MIGSVSIALVTRNGMSYIPEILNAIRLQNTSRLIELVVVDTASTDGTAELLGKRADVFVQISEAEFNHGTTRNLAIKKCSGEAVVLLVQDAVPCSTDWLENLVAPLESDPMVAGTYARQIPRPQAGRLTRWNLERWAAAGREGRTSRVSSLEVFSGLSPLQRLDACVFDNVCSCVRRSVWRRHPFRATRIAEDLEWAKEVLLAGYKTVFAPQAEVVHSHQRSLRYELERTILVHQKLRALFGVRTIPTFGALLRAIPGTAADHARVMIGGEGKRPSVRDLLRALGLALVWPAGQYIGGRGEG